MSDPTVEFIEHVGTGYSHAPMGNDSDWCHDCARAALARLRAEHAEMAALLERIVKRGWVHEGDFTEAASIVARIQGEAPHE